MTSPEKVRPYRLAEDEKASPVMVYMEESLAAGELVTKSVIRVSTWLRTPMAPLYLTLYNAQLLYGYSPGHNAPVRFSSLNIPLSHVYAFHLIPPLQDPPDYDQSEPNRKMEPATAVVGPFRFDGYLRMAASADLAKFLEVNKQTFTSLYDVAVSQPLRADVKPLKVPFVLLRSDIALIGTKY